MFDASFFSSYKCSIKKVKLRRYSDAKLYRYSEPLGDRLQSDCLLFFPLVTQACSLATSNLFSKCFCRRLPSYIACTSYTRMLSCAKLVLYNPVSLHRDLWSKLRDRFLYICSLREFLA